MNPVVSIIIPAYNAEKYISRCILSCINQTYSNLEVIIVNDGSFDNTKNIINDDFCHNPKVKLINSQNNGAALARLKGFEVAVGEYVFFLDSDDYLELEAIDKLVSIALSDDYDVAIGQSKVLGGRRHNEVTKFDLGTNNSPPIKSFLEGKIPVTLWPCLFKKKVLDKVDMLNRLIVGEDFVIGCQLYSLSNRVVVTSSVVHYYFKHEESVTAVMSKEKYRDNFKAFCIGISYIEKYNNRDLLQKSIMQNSVNYLFSLIKLGSSESNKCAKYIKSYRDSNNFYASDFVTSKLKCLLLKIILTFPVVASSLSFICRNLRRLIYRLS